MILLLAVVLFGVCGLVAWTFAGSPVPGAADSRAVIAVSEEARRLVAGGALLLDVRTPAEFAAGHLAGAVNVPVQELEARLGEIPADRQLVVYCRSGARSARATAMLRAGGHGAVFDLGPMSAW